MALEVAQAYTRSRQVLTPLRANTGTDLITLYQPGLALPTDRTAGLRYNGYLTNLRARIKVPSLPESTLPNLDTGSTRTDRITAVRNQEWGSPRYELDIFLRTTFTGWLCIATISLLNRPPFYITNLMGFLSDGVAFHLAAESVLACQLRNVGYGLLQGADEVIIFGDVREEAIALPTEGHQVSLTSDSSVTVGTTSQQVLPANGARKTATLTNSSSTQKIYLSYNPVASVGVGLLLYPNGGTLNIDRENFYAGAIAAIADAPGANLLVSEGV
jgi:hypothetical protein